MFYLRDTLLGKRWSMLNVLNSIYEMKIWNKQCIFDQLDMFEFQLRPYSYETQRNKLVTVPDFWEERFFPASV